MKTIFRLIKTGGTQEQRNLGWIILGCALLTMATGFFDTAINQLWLYNLAKIIGLIMIVKGFNVNFKCPKVISKSLMALVLTAGFFGIGILIQQTALKATGPASSISCRDDVSVSTWDGGNILRQGANPYEKYNFLIARNKCPNPQDVSVTLIKQGILANNTLLPSESLQHSLAQTKNLNQPEVEKGYNYPAGGFLIGAMGPWGILIVSTLLYLLVLFLLLKKAKPSLRLLLAMGYLMQIPLILTLGNGRMDSMAISMQVLAWLNIDNPAGAIFMGLAAGTKQTVWFFIPAFIGIIWYRESLKVALKRVGIMALGFLVLNLPFILLNPSAWFKGVLGPMFDGLFPLGVGPVGFINLGYLPTFLVPVLNVAMYLMVALSIPIALKFDKKYPGIAVLAGGLALWIGTRSLLSYMDILPFMVLAIYIQSASRRIRAPSQVPLPNHPPLNTIKST